MNGAKLDDLERRLQELQKETDRLLRELDSAKVDLSLGQNREPDRQVRAPVKPEASKTTPAIPPAREQDEIELLKDLLRRGDKIGAIKRYRDKTGAGLKEAKQVVEALARRMGL